MLLLNIPLRPFVSIVHYITMSLLHPSTQTQINKHIEIEKQNAKHVMKSYEIPLLTLMHPHDIHEHRRLFRCLRSGVPLLL